MNKKSFRYLQQFLTNCHQMNRSAHTISSYRSDLKKFLQWYEITTQNAPISRAKGDTISRYKSWLSKGGEIRQKTPLWKRLVKGPDKSPATIVQNPLSVAARKRHLSTLKNFFEYLKQSHEDKSRLFCINPVKSKLHSVRLKETDTIPTPMLSKKDWKILWESTWRPRERLIICLLYRCGLRIAELANLKVENIDLDKQTLTIQRKGGKVQTLLPQNRREVFRQITFWLTHRKSSSVYLLGNAKERPPTPRTLYNIVTRLLGAAGISHVTPHSFRKARATQLYLKTKDLLLVRDYLGHSDAKVTQSYIDKKTLAVHQRVDY